MNTPEMAELIGQCSFEKYHLTVVEDNGRVYLQGSYMDDDIITGEPLAQYTRKWILSHHMTKSEIVQTAFKLCLTSYEHRCGEHFQYRGKRIFGPHYDVDALWGVAGKVDVRE